MSREAGATKKAAVEAAPAKKAEPKSIKKRNGETVPFDAAKIQEAIRKACVAVPEEKISKKKLEELTAAVVAAIPGRRTPTVEQVQDLVEETLIREGFARTAKAYILYRAEHAKIRQSEGDLMEIYKELTFAYAKDADIKAAKDAADAAQADVDTLVGTDTGKSARTIANEELAKQLIPENANESLDTLAEIAAWIQAHPDDASAMNAAITKLQAILAGIGGDDEKATVVAYVTDAIAALSIGDYAKAADLTALAARVTALEADTHTHSNKTVLDGIDAAKVAAWDAAEQNAKDYADEALTWGTF